MSEQLNLSLEYALLDFANRMETHGKGRIALFFNFSKLRMQNRRDHHMRVVIKMLNIASEQHMGHHFELANKDSVLILRDTDVEAIDDLIESIRNMLANDPLAAQAHFSHELEENTSSSMPRLVEIISIGRDYQRFKEHCQYLLEAETSRQKRLRHIRSQSYGTIGTEKQGKSFTTEHLQKLESVLARSDLRNLIRRQPICKVNIEEGERNIEVQPALVKVYISSMELSRAIFSDVFIGSDQWLFMYVSRALDQRLLKILGLGDDNSLRNSISLNLNISTVLEQSFLSYDANLRDEDRSLITIEFRFIDIMQDYNAYVFARDFLKERGYRICLVGVTTDHLPLINRTYLGVDAVKFAANEHISDDISDSYKEYLHEQFERIGPKRIILSSCETQNAIRNGHGYGIRLFQGPALDGLLFNKSSYPSK